MALKGITKKTSSAIPGQTDYSEHLTVKPIEGLVQASKENKKTKETSVILAGQTEQVHPGIYTSGYSIEAGGGRTISLGNFEFARIDVKLTVPCDKDSINEAYDFATTWISNKLNEAVKQVTGG